MPPPPISLELPKERTPRDVPLPADSPLPASVISVTPQTPQAPVKEAAMLDVTVSEERITLDVAVLKRLSVTMRIPERAEAYPVEVERLSLKAQLLIAYMASARSKVPLGILREAIFGTDATYPEQVQQAFSTAKRDVRRRLDEAADLARQELGAALVPEDLALDLFKLVKNKRYRLPEYCRVVDLDLLWQQYRIIEHARANRELVQSVPEHVQHAAAAILTVWQGDFIEDLLDQADHAALIEDWPNYWAREPFTRLRHIYLEAVLYAAEYERKRGDADTARRKAYYEAAASLFAKGALAACNPRVFDGRFDLKVSFNKDPIGPHGSHVSRSEQYLRRALALFGIIGDTTAAAQLFADYRDQMQVCSGGIWSPHPKTARIVESVGQRTGAYQFSELVEVPDDLLSS